ncbi:hypothetical protein ACF07W_34875 [Streptomyces sp. NPDC015140]|uniref:hypothetical protein n=1 Tax=Streptomyces sp. NPDC015140 TaxID=3364943 RepID=UPI0036FC0F84
MTRTFAPTPSPAATAPGPARTRGLPRAVAVLRHPRRHAGRTAVGRLPASGGAHFPVRRWAAPGTRP